MENINRFLFITIGMVLLTGVLSGAVALYLTNRVSTSYDDVVETVLNEKALAYAETGKAFLDAAGPEAPAVIERLLLNNQGPPADDAPDGAFVGEAFGKAFLGLAFWELDGSEPIEVRRFLTSETQEEYDHAPSEELVKSVVSTAAATNGPAGTIDEQAHLLIAAVPISRDGQPDAVVVGYLSAEEEFHFIAAQRQSVFRQGLMLSVAIVLVVSVFGGALTIFVSRRLSLSNQALERSRYDALTNVLNHGAIVEELRTMAGDAMPGVKHAVAIIDVDGLKALNDTYGHQVGDSALAAVAKALTRDGAIVGRYGGDEFVAILACADRRAAERYRDDVLADVAGTRLEASLTGARVPIVISMGVAMHPDEASQAEDLLTLADKAMYASRRRRSITPGALPRASRLGSDQAAEMVGQIVPLLTSTGKLEDKLKLVAQRISVGAGYDAVDIDIFDTSGSDGIRRSNSFSRVPDEIVEAWHTQRPQIGDDLILQELQSTRRALILDDLATDDHLTDGQRMVIDRAGHKSGLVTPLFWGDAMIGTLGVASKRKADFTARDVQFLTAVADQVITVVRMASMVEDLQAAADRLVEANTQTVMMLAAAAETHDSTTGAHLHSVRAFTSAIAREMGYGDKDARQLGLAAVLHDIGKMRVPPSILTSAEPLKGEDWELVKRHTTWGAEFLANQAGFEQAAEVARCHHERWDGSGYPHGLSGEDIPEAATIVSVADAYDAMVQTRPYRQGRSSEEAIAEIVAGSGSQFSPKVVRAIVRLCKEQKLPHASQDAEEQAAA